MKPIPAAIVAFFGAGAAVGVATMLARSSLGKPRPEIGKFDEIDGISAAASIVATILLYRRLRA